MTARDHPDDRRPWWGITLNRDQPPWQQLETTLMTDNHDTRNHPDQRPPWWQLETTLMKDYPHDWKKWVHIFKTFVWWLPHFSVVYMPTHFCPFLNSWQRQVCFCFTQNTGSFTAEFCWQLQCLVSVFLTYHELKTKEDRERREEKRRGQEEGTVSHTGEGIQNGLQGFFCQNEVLLLYSNNTNVKQNKAQSAWIGDSSLRCCVCVTSFKH